MKTPIAFAVVDKLYLGAGFTVLAITSENRSRVFGREGDRATNRAHRQVHARYATEAEADAAVLRANEADAAHRPLVKAAERALRAAQDARDQARLDAVRPPATPPVAAPASRACNKPSDWPADRSDGPEDE